MTAESDLESNRLHSAPQDDGENFDDAQVLLAHALLTYRGFHDLRPWHLNRRRLREAVATGLDRFAPLHGDWELAWGPAAYRAPFTSFDDSVAFVAKHRHRPDTYVLAIRGTNPVSTFDWLVGDLWAGRQLTWPLRRDDHAGAAAVSLSTAIGLTSLRSLRSSVPPTGPVGTTWRFVDQDIGDPVRDVTAGAVVPVWRLFDGMTGFVGPPVHRRLRALARMHRDMPAEDPEARARRALGMWRSDLRQRLFRDLDLVFDAVGDDVQFEVIRFLEGIPLFRLPMFEGITLPDFLRSIIENAESEVDLYVTGHSKGGALAPALAVWLADTQGIEGVAHKHQWDPEARATVHCYAFAGPTPGNQAFADHIDQRLGSRNRRYYNALDVVPHAWAVRPDGEARGLYIDDVPGLYGDRIHRIDALDNLAEVVTPTMRPLDYAHTSAATYEVPSEIDPERVLYTDQMAFQHVDAYVAGLGLADHISTLDFMSPFR